jgi:hypothetical protein
MKNTLSKTLMAGAVAVTCFMASNLASAASVYPEFTIDQKSNGIVLSANQNQYVTANKIVGEYSEIISFTGDTFQASIIYHPAQFSLVGTPNPVRSGAGNDYALYAIYTASGTVNRNGTTASFTFVPSPSDSFVFYLDPGSTDATRTTFSEPLTGATAYGRAQSSDDIILATGDPITGAGSINCFASNMCGSFSTTTSFNLTDEGKLFFINPKPFYSLTIETGQFNGFIPSGLVRIDGSIDTIFAVPEPTSTALLGLGLLGFAASRRKWAKSKKA